MPKKIRVYRTHTIPNTAVTITEPTIAPRRNSSIEPTLRYFTINATE